MLVERALPHTLQAFRQVEHAGFQLRVKAQKIALRGLKDADAELDATVASASHKRKHTGAGANLPGGTGEDSAAASAVGAAGAAVVPQLKPSNAVGARSMVASVRASLATTWSPSHAKVHACLKELQKDPGNLTVTKRSLLEVAAEYVMLHLGSTKWRKRQWAAGAAEPATAERVDDGEDGEDGEDGNAIDGIDDDEGAAAAADGDGIDGSEESDSEDAEVGGQEAHDDSIAPEPEHETAAAKHGGKRRRVDRRRAKPPASTATVAGTATKDAAAAAAAAVQPDTALPPSPTPAAAPTLPTKVAVHVGGRAGIGAGKGDFELALPQPGPRAVVTPVGPDRLRGAAPWAGGVSTGVFMMPSVNPLDPRAVGRWGEALVYQYLLMSSPTSVVKWMNEKEETKAAYDIVVTDRSGSWSSTRYIEVKSTRFSDRNVFELSHPEWEFAAKDPPVKYDVYRVFDAGSPAGPRIAIIEDVVGKVREREVRLCLAI